MLIYVGTYHFVCIDKAVSEYGNLQHIKSHILFNSIFYINVIEPVHFVYRVRLSTYN